MEHSLYNNIESDNNSQKGLGKHYNYEIFNTLNNEYNVTPEVYNEMKQIKKNAIEGGYFLKSPNRLPSNLDEKSWLLARTKNFKKWFGDWENAVYFTANNIDNIAELKEKYPSTLPNKYYHHSTNKFGKQVYNSKEGTPKKLHIIGRLITDKVDVLVVENSNSENEIAHITLATAEGIKPYESNIELKNNRDKIQPLNDYVDTTFTNNLKRNISQILDKNGEPKIMYHGSNRRHISEFKIDTQKHEGTKDGIYFTSNREKAKEYSINGTIYENFLNIRNPLIIDFKGNYWCNLPFQDAQILLGKSEEELKGIQKPYYKTNEIEDIINTFKKIAGKFTHDENKRNYAIDDIVKIARHLGYDGIIAKDMKDIGKFPSISRKTRKTLHDQIIVLYPNQIKDINNIGTFSKDSNNTKE